jgi:ribonucleotide monophosphatase NagD (HAD superfamily)
MQIPSLRSTTCSIATTRALRCLGRLHNGRRLYPGAAAALQRARNAGKYVIAAHQRPEAARAHPGQLDRAGVPRDAWDAIVTSGDAIAL